MIDIPSPHGFPPGFVRLVSVKVGPGTLVRWIRRLAGLPVVFRAEYVFHCRIAADQDAEDVTAADAAMAEPGSISLEELKREIDLDPAEDRQHKQDDEQQSDQPAGPGDPGRPVVIRISAAAQ